MARNTGKIKRGWSYDKANSRLDVYVDGTKVAYFDGANAIQVFDNTDILLGDADYMEFGDASGGDVSIRWTGSVLEALPATDDTGAVNIGNGTKDIDVKIFLNASTKYALFDVGNSYFSLEDVDLRLGDNDEVKFGDGSGGDVRVTWNGSLLSFLPLTDDTGYIAIGNGTNDMDFTVFLNANTKYVQFDVGNSLLTLEDVDLKLGDNDYLQIGDASGGDVSMRWDASLLQILPATDDTGYIAIGNGTKDMDLRVYLGTNAKYALFDVGNSYFSLVNVSLYAPNLASTAGQAGIIYAGADGIVRKSP